MVKLLLDHTLYFRPRLAETLLRACPAIVAVSDQLVLDPVNPVVIWIPGGTTDGVWPNNTSESCLSLIAFWHLIELRTVFSYDMPNRKDSSRSRILQLVAAYV